MIRLDISSTKKLSLVSSAKIYYGENRIGSINIYLPDKIGDIESDELDFTLYVSNASRYLSYALEVDENNFCSIPITNDITDTIGSWELYVEITNGDIVIGKTNTKQFTVLDFQHGNVEIPKREELFAAIDNLTELLSLSDNALDIVKNALISSGINVTDSTTISEYGNLILSLPSINMIVGIIEKTITELTIPPEATTIAAGVFHDFKNLVTVNIGENTTEIDDSAFSGCSKLRNVYFPSSLTRIGDYAFENCVLLNEVILPHGLTYIGSNCFYQCERITRIFIPNTITQLGYHAFYYTLSSNCDVIIENGLSVSGVNLRWVSNATVEQILSWFNALADLTGESTGYFSVGNNNLNKMTNEQIAIATNKNWNIS